MLHLFVAVQSYFVAQNRRREETGASAVEYGLLVALIAGVIVVAVIAFGGKISGIFTDTCKAINKGTACP